MQKMAFIKWRGRCETLPEQEQEHCHLFVSSVSVASILSAGVDHRLLVNRTDQWAEPEDTSGDRCGE